MSTTEVVADHSKSPGACKFVGETIEVSESFCSVVAKGGSGLPKEGLCFRGFGPRYPKPVAQKSARE